MQTLGVVPSYSRPRASNDNAYAEALFRTARYCPLWIARPFGNVQQARQWVLRFVAWYNEEHRHSALKYVRPGQRHRRQYRRLLQQRMQLYAQARKHNPQRRSAGPLNWHRPDEVCLNPERAQNEMSRRVA
ncbi:MULTISPECIES: integrase core domain-containing protein [Comamonas]|uniref:integrase core domain-containing protein n=1 Tax=Comamonas TaxID=283 RepID=UPI0021134987|nr:MULTISPECIES: integrase core domain-containing protein [Comamonas]UUC94821.1 integrase core domain-containing protein [Comamonas sp. C11]WEE78860.1 integrase core domain-containing protein [Comamonas testosteroni]